MSPIPAASSQKSLKPVVVVVRGRFKIRLSANYLLRLNLDFHYEHSQPPYNRDDIGGIRNTCIVH